MGTIISYLCHCFESILDCLSSCFPIRDNQRSLSDLIYDHHQNATIATLPAITPIPRNAFIVTAKTFEKFDEMVKQNPKDPKLVEIYKNLPPTIICQKLSKELCFNIMGKDLKSFKAWLEFTKNLGNSTKGSINPEDLDGILSNCLSFNAEHGSIEILQELMSFIVTLPKEDQEYILKAYPLALEVAAKQGHINFIKELTNYFCRIVPKDYKFFKKAQEDVIIKVKSTDGDLQSSERIAEVLTTLESLKYEFQKGTIFVSITEVLNPFPFYSEITGAASLDEDQDIYVV